MAQSNPAQVVQNIYKTPELWQKIVFTFVCLVVYRTGAHVTAPGPKPATSKPGQP